MLTEDELDEVDAIRRQCPAKLRQKNMPNLTGELFARVGGS